jgi:ketosteroid isomerase-like protein
MNDVLELVNRWAAAEESNDPARIDALLATDFVGVGAAGFVLTREQWLGRFGGGLRNRTFAIEEPQVHAHGADAAVVVGVDAQETTFGERDVSGRFRCTLTAVRTEGWRVAAVHIGAQLGGPR